ncbi:MAG TPA: sulfite exporter TauE/SafE family protein [Cyclobacteriaceae bacterium]|nr:sulfite exporter TauE/SafE family protein [Cyclobacteriaceae bacterium]
MLITAFILGFAGSLHCVGMCSPLAMAVTNMKRSVLLNKLLYNLGRILTYGLFGAMISLAGFMLPLSKFQNLFSIILGIILLIIGISGVSRINVPVITSGAQKLSSFLKIQFGKFYQRKTYLSILILGTFNGILPCGLTFIALSYCLTMRSPLEGFAFMILFGMGTLPAMFGLPSLMSLAVIKLNWSLSKITTVLLIVSGSLLVARVFIITYAHAHSIQEGVDIVLCR